MDVWELVSWGLWLGFAAGVGSFLYGVAMRILGKEEGARYAMGGLASILVVAFGWGLVQALYGGTTPPVPYGWVFYAVAGVLLASAAVYLALGRMAEGSWSLVGALLIVGIGFFAASLTTGVEIGPGGTVSVNVVPSTTMLKNNEELRLTVTPAGGEPPYSVAVAWGDGTSSTESTSTNVTFTKKYSIPGDRPADSYTIRVDVVDSRGRTGFNILAVTVQNQDYCPLGWPWSVICWFKNIISVVVPALDLQKLVECPLFPTSGELHDLYSFILGVSMGALGLFLAFDLAWAVIGREDVASGLVQSLKDAVVVVALALLAPYVYNATAQMLNAISYQLVGRIAIGWVFAWVMLQIVLGVVVGYFVPFMANYAAFMAVTLFLASVVVYIRYVLIITLVAASPLLAICYLHPGLRGMVKHLVTLLAGLMLAGPLAAVFLVVLNKVVPGQDIVLGILYPLIVGALPTILGTFGVGAIGGVAGAVRAGVSAIGGAVAQRLGGGRAAGMVGHEVGAVTPGAQLEVPRTVRIRVPTMAPARPVTVATPTAPARVAVDASVAAEPGATTRVVAPPTGHPGEEPARLRPIVTPGMVKHAAAEGKAVRAVAESVREMQEYGPAMLSTLGEAERARQVEEQVRRELVRPRWESFRAFASDLSKQSWRQLKTNLRAYGSEFWHGLRYLSERELGVRLPEKVSFPLRVVKRERLAALNNSRIASRKVMHDIALRTS